MPGFLFLYPDRVVVRTFDHRKGDWLEGAHREVRPWAPAVVPPR